MKLRILPLLILAIPLSTRADLIVTVDAPKAVGQKAIIKLELKNTFPEKIDSARAVLFLLNEKGKMLGQSTKWVVGGTKANPGLDVGKETTFNFVVQMTQPVAPTNLTSKITFSQVVLEGGKQANPVKQVQINTSPTNKQLPFNPFN